jgi:hypothetical protein
MALTIHKNDTRAERLTGPGRHEGTDMNSAGGPAKFVEDAKGLVVEFGRGASDPRITYFALFNTNGTKCYVFPNAAGDGVLVSTVQP